MNHLLTHHNTLSRYISRLRDLYPETGQFERIMPIKAYLLDQNRRSKSPLTVANQGQMLSICETVTGNLDTAGHLSSLYNLVNRYKIKWRKWQSDPDPVIQQNFKWMHELEHIRMQYGWSSTYDLMHLLTDTNTVLNTQFPEPYLSNRINPLNLNSLSSAQVVNIPLSSKITPDIIGKVVASEETKHYVISGCDSHRLTFLSGNNCNLHETRHPEALIDTKWFGIWHQLWSLNTYLIRHQIINQIIQSPYIQLKSVTLDDQQLFQRARHTLPSQLISIDTHNDMPAALRQLVMNHLSIITKRHLTGSEWLQLSDSIGHLWGISTPSNAYHDTLLKQWQLWRQQIAVAEKKRTHDEWIQFSKIIAQTIFIHPQSESQNGYYPLAEVAGIRSDCLILFDMDLFKWNDNVHSHRLPDDDHLTILEHSMQQKKFLIESILQSFKKIIIITEPDSAEQHVFRVNETVNLRPSDHPKHHKYVAYNRYKSTPYTPSKLPSALTHMNYYAMCYTKGFIFHRLGAMRQHNHLYGTDARLRGIIVHECLALNLNKTARHAFITEQLNKANKFGYTIPLNMMAFETNRLLDILNHHDTLVAEQPSLGHIHSTEVAVHGTIQNLDLSARIDAICVSNDSSAIIDYKTSTHTIAGCLTGRLLSPQLPVYALLYNKRRVGGVGYINLEPHKASVSGLKWDHSLDAPFKPIDNQQLSLWEEQIKDLLQNIRSGSSSPNPMNAAQCKSCEVQFICRHQTLDTHNYGDADESR